jgi:hypothetical protein
MRFLIAQRNINFCVNQRDGNKRKVMLRRIPISATPDMASVASGSTTTATTLSIGPLAAVSSSLWRMYRTRSMLRHVSSNGTTTTVPNSATTATSSSSSFFDSHRNVRSMATLMVSTMTFLYLVTYVQLQASIATISTVR